MLKTAKVEKNIAIIERTIVYDDLFELLLKILKNLPSHKMASYSK